MVHNNLIDDDKLLSMKFPLFSGRLGHIEDVFNLVLILGRGCNMNCPHCSQNTSKHIFSSAVLQDNVINWICDWVEMKSDSVVAKKSLLFYGGEALLYWDNIVKLVNVLSANGVDSSKLLYRIYTNGKLLSKEKLDFMAVHDFEITLSYDLPDPLLMRNEVPSDECLQLFNDYPCEKFVNSVYCAKTPSLIEVFQEQRRLFPTAMNSISWIKDGLGVNKDLILFPAGKVKNDILELYNAVIDERITGIKFFKTYYKKFISVKGYSNLELISYPFPFCSSLVNSLTIDLTGNIYLCHNGNNSLGSVFDNDIFEFQKQAIEIWRHNLPRNCVDCTWASLCSSGCSEFTRTEDGSRLTQCEFFRELYSVLQEVLVGNGG